MATAVEHAPAGKQVGHHLTSLSYSQVTRCTWRGMGTTTSSPAALFSCANSARTLMKMIACRHGGRTSSGRICQWLLTCWSPGCINPRPCNCAIPSSCKGLAPSCAGPVDLALSSQQLQERACGGLPHVCACVNARRSPGTALLAASSSASIQAVDFGMSCVCVCAHDVHGQAMLRQTKSRQPHLVGSIAIIFYCCVNFEGRFEVKGAPAVTLTNLRVAEWLTSLQGHGAAMSSPQQQSMFAPVEFEHRQRHRPGSQATHCCPCKRH